MKTKMIFGNRPVASRGLRSRLIWVVPLVTMMWGSGISPANAASYDKGGIKAASASASASDGADKDSSRAPTDSSNANSKSARPDAADSEKFNALDDKVRRLEDIIKQQQLVIDSLQNRLDGLTGPATNPSVAPAPAERTKVATASASTGQPNVPASPKAISANAAAQAQKPVESPLQFHIGLATITPLGFVDAISVFRTTNTGSGVATSFGNIPFENTIPGNLTENRFSLQNSRIGARIDADVKGWRVLGYWESDFNGGATAAFPNLDVTTNGDIFRMRLFWVDIRRDKLEILGGQSWSMMTPNRVGLSPLPNDIFYAQNNVDVNYQVGLVWARQPQYRIVYHPSSTVAMGLSLENPEQYVGGSGGAGVITAPSALAASYIPTQLDNGTTGITTPNLHPDIVAKVAFDPKVSGRAFHIELAGLARSFKVFNPLTVDHFTTTGGGAALNFNFEIFKNFRLLSNNFWSDGGGRYIFGQAPDLVVRGNGSLSLVHSYSTVQGVEAQVFKNTLLDAYYGGVYIQKNVIIDPVTGKPVGYGFPGSGPTANRSVQEITGGLTQTFWRDPKYGGLQFLFQYSYVTRHPWSVPAGQPGGAHTNMVFLDLKYLFPGAAPKVTY